MIGFARAQAAYENAEPPNTDCCEGCEDSGCEECTGSCCDHCSNSYG